MPKKTCFVIGPIGACGSPEREHADTFLRYIVEPCDALGKFDYGKPVRADQMGLPGQITTQIIEHLINYDLVIADLTGHNPNVFYELSLRHAVGKAVVQMGGIPLPFDIHASRTIPFSFDVREVEKAREALRLQISEINRSGYQASNVIKEANTVIEIARTGTPENTAILRAVQDIATEVRFLTGEVQIFKQRGEAIVSGPTGPPGAYIAMGELHSALSRYPAGPTGPIGRAFAGSGTLAIGGTSQSPLTLRAGDDQPSGKEP